MNFAGQTVSVKLQNASTKSKSSASAGKNFVELCQNKRKMQC